MPMGTGWVYLHLGYVVHARNSPKRPVLITIGAPHSLQITSEGRSGILSLLIEREKVHSFGYLAQAMNGPNRPLRSSTGLPQVGQRSSWRLERSCTSWMIRCTSTAASASENGPQKSPSTFCQARSPSSTLSSSV